MPQPPQPPTNQDATAADHQDYARRLRAYKWKNTIKWGIVSAFAVVTFCGTTIMVVQRGKNLELHNELDYNNAEMEKRRKEYKDGIDKLQTDYSERLSEHEHEKKELRKQYNENFEYWVLLHVHSDRAFPGAFACSKRHKRNEWRLLRNCDIVQI